MKRFIAICILLNTFVIGLTHCIFYYDSLDKIYRQCKSYFIAMCQFTMTEEGKEAKCMAAQLNEIIKESNIEYHVRPCYVDSIIIGSKDITEYIEDNKDILPKVLRDRRNFMNALAYNHYKGMNPFEIDYRCYAMPIYEDVVFHYLQATQ